MSAAVSVTMSFNSPQCLLLCILLQHVIDVGALDDLTTSSISEAQAKAGKPKGGAAGCTWEYTKVRGVNYV